MRFVLIILLLTFFVNSFAQPVTEDGVVVNQAGDTTAATITIPRSDKNPTYIDVTQGDTTKRYRPHEIRYFRFGEGASYAGAVLNLDKSGSATAASYYYNSDYLRYNLGGRYYFKDDKLKPYVQVGVGIGKAYRSSYFSGLPVNQNFTPSKADRGIHCAAGLKYGRLGIQLRYERSSGFSETPYFIPRVNNLSAFATLDFNKAR